MLITYVYKCCEFRKNSANESLVRGEFMAEIRNFDSFGTVFPHFCPDERETWHGPLPVPSFTFIGATLRGEKPILDH